MKKLISLIFLIYCTLVSATTYYVSSSGNDAANGTSTSTPWKTIAKVNAKFSTIKPGDRILFRRSDTFHGTLKVAASGSSGNPIVVSAYGSGADPIITGFQTLTSWTNEGNGIFSRSVASASRPNFIVIGGKMYAMGRFPNSSYLSYESYSSNYSITDNQLSSSPNWNGAEAVIRKSGWILDRCKITGHSGTKITYSNLGTTTSGTANYGYFIQNSLKTLDVFGEWYYNGIKMYVYFGSKSPSVYKVEVPTIDNLVYNKRFSYINFENLQFIGSGESSMILETYADNNIVRNCKFNFSGEHSVLLPIARYARIDNNNINNSVGSGIFVEASIKVVITNNSIKNSGTLKGASFKTSDNAGIYCVYSDDALIQYNSTDSSGYNGIRFNGNRVQVKNNFIKNSVLLVNDGAAIYTSGTTFADRVIEGNIIVNSFGNTDGTNKPLAIYADGIYLDGPSKNILVKNNTVSGCRRSGIFFHESHDNNCTGNTSYDNAQQVRFQFGNVYPNDKIRNNVFRDNILISKTSASLALWARSSLEDIPYFILGDYNYYARPIDDNAVIYTQSPTSGINNRSLSSWKSFSKQDVNSKKSPVAVKSTSEIELFYNTGKSNKVVALTKPMIDVKGTKYASSITLLPYASAVLMVDPAPTAAPSVPVYISSAIENATPSLLELTYNLSLANIIPANSAFNVRVNSVSRTVSSVAISGSKVLLTLASPVIHSDIITIAYTKPSLKPLQNTSGGQAASFTAKSVNSNISSQPAEDWPVYLSSVIESATPNKLEMTYSLSLANIIPAASSFIVRVNSVLRTVSSVSISDTKVILTLSGNVVKGDVISVAYNRPANNKLQTPSGYWAAALSAKSVNFNISSLPAEGWPVYLSSVIESATPNKLEITFSLNLANIIPPASSFVVRVNSVNKSLSSIVISGSKLMLTLSSPVSAGNVVTVTYTRPSTNKLQTPRGYWAEAITSQPVVNKVSSLKSAQSEGATTAFLGSAIENHAPEILEMTFNSELASSIPENSAFVVKVNGMGKSVTSVDISNNKIRLTLPDAVASGDKVTVAYIGSEENPILSKFGEKAETLEEQIVQNNLTESSASLDDITIYPNPASEFINISIPKPFTEQHKLKIYDFSGKVCMESYLDPDLINIVVPINLKSGLYIVKVENVNSILFTRQLVVVE